MKKAIPGTLWLFAILFSIWLPMHLDISTAEQVAEQEKAKYKHLMKQVEARKWYYRKEGYRVGCVTACTGGDWERDSTYMAEAGK
jgi:hypothetical protein